MKRVRRPLLALLLVMVMLVGLVPVNVHAAEECQHKPTWGWGSCEYMDEEKHYNTCALCGANMTGPHTNDENGVCTVCGRQEPGEHECQWEMYAQNPYGHYEYCILCFAHTKMEYHGGCFHAGCPTCGGNGGMLPDADLDCICDYCGAEEHAVVWRKDANYHWTGCNCGEESSEKELHDTNGAYGACSKCGYNGSCTHEGEHFYQKSNDGHTEYCYNCKESIAEMEAHTMVGNECAVCGFVTCGAGNHEFDRNASSWSKHRCLNCDYFEPCNIVNCVCTICGIDSHVLDWMNQQRDENYHWYVCSVCGGDVYRNPHDTNGAGGSCSQCGYGCTHANVDYGKDPTGHIEYCADCYKVFTEWEAHTMVDGKCSVCGYFTCADGNHTYNRNANGYNKHLCLNCDYREGCTPGENCVCTICGGECHVVSMRYDDTNHWYQCDSCGSTDFDLFEPHNADMPDGSCSVCHNGCTHTNAVTWYGDEYHYQYCNDCYRMINTEPHNIVDGKCTGCDYTTEESTEPVETEPVETEPVETEPVETEPVETEPVETEPVETEPVETEPVETEPVETEPVETEPVETEPVETEPVETEPVETEPVETEPVETEPVETEPVETEPVQPGPDDVPKTGDSSIAVLGLAALFGIIALVTRFRLAR